MFAHNSPRLVGLKGFTLTQRSVNDKTNEIPISTQILEAFDVSGKVITTDALLTQRAFCEKVVAAEGDYVLPVQKNQEHLFWTIETLFQSDDDTFSDDAVACETYEKGHGRLETRCLKASTALNDYLDWPGLAQVFDAIPAKICARVKKHIQSNMVSQVLIRQQHLLNAYSLDSVDIGQ